MGHTMTENRHGLIVNITVTEANGSAERSAALDMLDEVQTQQKRKVQTLGADKGYDDGGFYQDVEKRKVEPHVPLVKEPRDPTAVHIFAARICPGYSRENVLPDDDLACFRLFKIPKSLRNKPFFAFPDVNSTAVTPRRYRTRSRCRALKRVNG
jgi:Transposase DDE domain